MFISIIMKSLDIWITIYTHIARERGSKKKKRKFLKILAEN